MPKDNSLRQLTPKELAEWQLLVSEISEMVITTHMPVADVIGLFFSGRLIYKVLDMIRYIFISDPITSVSRAYCSRSYNYTEDLSVDESLNQIRPLVDYMIPLEHWPTYMTGTTRYYFETLIDFNRVCNKINLLFPNKVLKDKFTRSINNLPEIQENFLYKTAIPDPTQFHAQCDYSIELYKRFQYYGELSAELKVNQQNQISNYQFSLVTQSELERITELNVILERVLPDLTSNFTDFFNGIKFREFMQICVAIKTGTIVNLAGWILTKILLRMILLKFPLGVFPLLLKSCENKAHLMANTSKILTTKDYSFHIQQLEAIKRNITPWHNLLIFLMRGCLIVSWIIMLWTYISKNKEFRDTSILMGILQALLLAYSLHGLIPFLQQRYQHYRRDQLLDTQLRHLVTLSQNLSLPDWKLIIKSTINSRYFLLEWLSSSQDANKKNKDDKNKIILNSILECFLRNNIRVYYHSNKQIILLEDAVSFNEQKINQLTNEIKIIMQQLKDQQSLYNELKILSRHFDIPLYRVETKIGQHKQCDYYFQIPKAPSKEPIVNQFLSLLKKQYGEHNVTDKIINNDRLITLVANKPSDDSNILMKFSDVQFANPKKSTTHAPALVFSPIEQNATESDEPRVLKRKDKTNTTSEQTPSVNLKPSEAIIKFGIYGEYDPSNPNSRIKEISAPFWRAKTHFMIFAAPKEAFLTDIQHSKFKTILPRVVSGKNQKGIVSSGGRIFSEKGNSFRSHLKLKDPSEDTRVFDRVETFGAVHLHIFDRVVSKSH